MQESRVSVNRWSIELSMVVLCGKLGRTLGSAPQLASSEANSWKA